MISYTWPRNLNSDEAKTMMIDTLRWREEFNIEGAMNETYPDVFDGFGHLYGRDKEGRPVVYCPFPAVPIRPLDLMVPLGIISMGGITILQRPSATSSGLFGTPLKRFF